MSNILFLEEDIWFDFTLYAIQSNTEDYYLTFNINKSLNFQFKRIEDQNIYYNNQKFSFINYYYYDIEMDMELYLISNISIPNKNIVLENSLFNEIEDTIYLLPSIKTYNFILRSNQDLNSEILLNLQAVKSINIIKNIDFKNIKEKENLIIST